MKRMVMIVLLSFCLAGYCQDEHVLNDQQLEDLAETEEYETEDEYTVQQLAELIRDPININDPSLSLSELPILNSMQIANLISYRNLLGAFISVYELQAVPGFTTEIIKKLLPYISVADPLSATEVLKKRFKGGTHHVLTRPTLPSKLYSRYRYQYRNLLQYGALVERDAGEKALIDFYSAHLFVRNIGIIKSLAVGDFTLNLGQGLIHWQSQAFRKTSSVINVKRQAEIIRPYHSAGEYNYQRGVAFTLQKKRWETTMFFSHRKLTGNISEDNMLGSIITSINTSGLHRTSNELADKNSVALSSYGMNVKRSLMKGHIGINAVNYKYSLPFVKRDQPYNIYALKGRYWSNASLDFSITSKNVHWFGEAAVASNKSKALVAGLMTSLHAAIDLAVLFRSIDKNYQSLYGNAFTENTMPSNEDGVYLGLSIRPHSVWKLDAYADFFRFPWLKFRVNAPSAGSQYLVQVTWKPGRLVEVYSRFRYKSKPLNISEGVRTYPDNYIQRNWRTNISYQFTKTILLRSRVEACWYRHPALAIPQNGYLFYSDIIYKPMGRSYSGSCRMMFFESNSYETRIYAYENDVLFASTIPSFYKKGTRVYFTGRAKVRALFRSKFGVDLGVKAAATMYSDESGDGKPVNPEFKVQVLLVPEH